ncbi:MAG: DUF3794 domain-containing protein [Lachnospiraceae bacterium]|nr:DUF3794 domain-containing protein [Lachnospiraceae bacterium]
MEIIYRQMYKMITKAEASLQLTFDEDYNVPDQKADVGRMIQKKGRVEIEEVKVSENHVLILGKLIFCLLYVAEGDRGQICSLEGNLPIEENMNLDGVCGGDKINLTWELEDLSIRVINSRKLGVKALVSFQGRAEEEKSLQLPTGIDAGDVSCKKKSMTVMELKLHNRDTMRIKEEFQLSSNKPDIYEIRWENVEVRGVDIRAEEDQVMVKGEVFVFVLYCESEESNSMEWLEYSIPFHNAVPCEGCTTEMIPNIEVAYVQGSLEVKPDADGMERILVADIVMELNMKIYQEESLELLQDVYTPTRDYQVARQEEELESLLVKNYGKCRISEHIPMDETDGKILQVCHSEGTVKIDRSDIVENGIALEGVLQLKILYIIGDDDMPFYSMEAMIPFSHTLEAEGIHPGSRYYLQAELEQLSTTMLDNKEIEVKALINLNALVLDCWIESVVQGITQQELDWDKIQQMPGIVGYVVKSQDTLWDIAKRFYTTSESICTMNQLEEAEIHPGQCLILVKNVEG